MFLNAYDRTLHQTEDQTNHLGSDVLQMLQISLEALRSQNTLLAHGVCGSGQEIDTQVMRIEENVLQLISIQQPRQKDLRILAAILRNIRELERIAAYSLDIADIAEYCAGRPLIAPFADVVELAGAVQDTVERALAAVKEQDAVHAEQIARRKHADINRTRAIHDQLVATMQEDSRVVGQASHLLLAVRYLDRIADHAANLGEMVLFVEHGEPQAFHHTIRPACRALG